MELRVDELARDRKSLATFHTATAVMAVTAVILVVLMFLLGVEAGKAAALSGETVGDLLSCEQRAEGEQAAKSARAAT